MVVVGDVSWADARVETHDRGLRCARDRGDFRDAGVQAETVGRWGAFYDAGEREFCGDGGVGFGVEDEPEMAVFDGRHPGGDSSDCVEYFLADRHLDFG